MSNLEEWSKVVYDDTMLVVCICMIGCLGGNGIDNKT